MSMGVILGSVHHPSTQPRTVHLPTGGSSRASVDDHVRRQRDIADDFYPTPPEATRALLSVEQFDASIWEPACGEGHIARVLTEAGNRVVATDLNDRGFGIVGCDFLRETRPRAKHIITNPPYGRGLADAFLHKALTFTSETGGTIAMLLNLASLVEPSRTALWRAHPPARLYAIDDIVCWPERVRRPPAHFARQRYVWAVWTQDHCGAPRFWWLSGADFRTGKSTRNPNTRR